MGLVEGHLGGDAEDDQPRIDRIRLLGAFQKRRLHKLFYRLVGRVRASSKTKTHGANGILPLDKPFQTGRIRVGDILQRERPRHARHRFRKPFRRAFVGFLHIQLAGNGPEKRVVRNDDACVREPFQRLHGVLRRFQFRCACELLARHPRENDEWHVHLRCDLSHFFDGVDFMFAAQFDQNEGIADALKASPVVFTPFDIQINAFRLHKSETGKRHTFVRQNGPEPRHAVVLRDGDDGLAATFADADHQPM